MMIVDTQKNFGNLDDEMYDDLDFGILLVIFWNQFHITILREPK